MTTPFGHDWLEPWLRAAQIALHRPGVDILFDGPMLRRMESQYIPTPTIWIAVCRPTRPTYEPANRGFFAFNGARA